MVANDLRVQIPLSRPSARSSSRARLASPLQAKSAPALRLTWSHLQPGLSQTSTNIPPFAGSVLAIASGWHKSMVQLLRRR